MRIRVGNIGARCTGCSGEDFQPLASGWEVLCFGCGARIARRALLMQIADETVRRAERFLEASRSGRGSTSKRSA
jgi:hypothetical protein